ncbi:phage portal protein [Arcanobacterium hippocoleae]
MNLLRPKSKLFENHTIESSYSFMFGPTSAGKPVTERSAMQMTAVYACVRILSEAIAGLPLHVYRYEDDGRRSKALEHPLYVLLHDEPNPEMTSFVFRETLMTHLLLWGNAYAQVIRNGRGDVVGLYPLMPNRMQVGRNDNGELEYVYTRTGDEPNVDAPRKVTLTAADVLHIPDLGFDGLVGYSPIAMAKNAIGLAIATEEYGASFFANGAAPGGVLEHPGTIKDPARESWQQTFGGARNSNKIAVLEEGMTYTPIGISPEQAQFLETRKFQINEIARIFRIPPHMVGDLEKSSFSNIEQQSLEFVKYTLDPWVIRREQAITKLCSRLMRNRVFVVRSIGVPGGKHTLRREKAHCYLHLYLRWLRNHIHCLRQQDPKVLHSCLLRYPQGHGMKAIQMNHEAVCRVTLALAEKLRVAGAIFQADYQRVREALIGSYQPAIMALLLPQRLDKWREQSDV